MDKFSAVVGKPNIEQGNIKDYSLTPMGIISVDGMGEQRFAVNTANSALLVADMVELAGQINVDNDLMI